MNAEEAATRIYEWCTGEGKATSSARTLAEIYVSTYMDKVRLMRFADLKTLDDSQREWALTLIQGYSEGIYHATYDRAMELADLYSLHPDHEQGEQVED